MYSQTEPASGNRANLQFTRQRGPRRSGRRSAVRPQERLRLAQLLICLVLFLAVFLGKGIFPERMLQVKDELLSLITANTDFRAALSNLGASLADSGTVLDDLGQFCVEVFGGEPEELPAQPAASFSPPEDSALELELSFLKSSPDRQSLSAHYWRSQCSAQVLPALAKSPPEPEPAVPENAMQTPVSVPEPGPAAGPPAGSRGVDSAYDGGPPPEHYTMDLVSLGDLTTADPITGRLTSGYGYRENPITGKHQFHGGTDISGNKGDPIGAFADGVVEYIGKNDSYGLYLQIDHGNGVKSFYAHCSKLCVSKGQTVSLGEKVAEVGDTGCATASHLHLELKYNQTHLNPAYYVQFTPAG